MPELPEVETVVRDLRRKLIGQAITDLWQDQTMIIKDWRKQRRRVFDPVLIKRFRRDVLGKRVVAVQRRGKNILIFLEGDICLLVHLKMTGHFLFGDWSDGQRRAENYIHVVFNLDSGTDLAFSDVRKFGKILWGAASEILNLPEIVKLGPEPMEDSFTREVLSLRLIGVRTPLKPVLMDPKRIAGIGNIYADEILWRARISPYLSARDLKSSQIKSLHVAIRAVLSRAIDLRGTSMRDYRDTSGEKGSYYDVVSVYGRHGKPCRRCRTQIVREVLRGRSTHFCPRCQPRLA